MRQRKHFIDIVFVLMAALVFAGSVLVLLTMGADVYETVSEETREGGDEKIALSYIATKIRQGDDAGMVSICDFHGMDAVSLKFIVDGWGYETLIYVYEGYLYELFFEEGMEFRPEDGEKLIRAEALKLSAVNNKLICIELTGRDGMRSMYISIKSEGGFI